jgi:hypothetical protein
MGVPASDSVYQSEAAALKRGLQELGWTEGRNLQILGRVDRHNGCGWLQRKHAPVRIADPFIMIAHVIAPCGKEAIT